MKKTRNYRFDFEFDVDHTLMTKLVLKLSDKSAIEISYNSQNKFTQRKIIETKYYQD